MITNIHTFQLLKLTSNTITVIFIITYLLIVNQFTQNVPFYDDYDAIGAFLIKIKSSNPVHFIPLLTEQYAEHRIVFTRLVALLYYIIFGTINFKHLILFGITGLCGIIYLIYKQLKEQKYWPLLLLPLTLILFNFQFYENLYSAMTSLQNLYIPFFALLSFYLATHSPAKSSILYLVTTITLFTSGNGITLLPIILAFKIYTKKSPKELFNWCLFSIILGLIYFLTYQIPQAQFGNRSNVYEMLLNPIAILENIVIFIATSFSGFGFSNEIITAIGSFLLTIFIYYIVLTLRKKQITPFEYWIILSICFLLSTSILVALNRGNSVNNMFVSRYKIYSTLFIIFGLLILYRSSKVTIRLKLLVAIPFSILFCLSSFTYLNNLIQEYLHLKYATATFHLNNGKWKGIYPPYTSSFANDSIANNVSHSLINLSMYHIPYPNEVIQSFSAINKIQLSKPPKNPLITESNNHLKIEFEHAAQVIEQPNFILLEGKNKRILLPVYSLLNNKDLLKVCLGVPTITKNNYSVIEKFNLEKGNYTVWAIIQSKNSHHKFLVKQLNIAPLQFSYYHN